MREGAVENIASKMEEMEGSYRSLYNEELHNLYASPDIWVIKTRRMRWAGHVAGMAEMRMHTEL
jgi:hypothetical protein